MIGTIAPLRFWICAAGEPWSERERRNAEIACTDAYSWLEGQALRYGVSLRSASVPDANSARQGQFNLNVVKASWMPTFSPSNGCKS